ncbi:hypothetical protein CBR_g46856 [Chara braunii]|uniref:Lon N-terminal domain-containing protein n=1 Tax=Chara braunii TaxID=69332 RepID=A0A388M146_CHABU|nr:hypothetical protein CBR_g46856 [Chara braunii]|eukprot:GBG88290.1 hypothetical protein CBR_g46856 [Chara braunii]
MATTGPTLCRGWMLPVTVVTARSQCGDRCHGRAWRFVSAEAAAAAAAGWWSRAGHRPVTSGGGQASQSVAMVTASTHTCAKQLLQRGGGDATCSLVVLNNFAVAWTETRRLSRNRSAAGWARRSGGALNLNLNLNLNVLGGSLPPVFGQRCKCAAAAAAHSRSGRLERGHPLGHYEACSSCASCSSFGSRQIGSHLQVNGYDVDLSGVNCNQQAFSSSRENMRWRFGHQLGRRGGGRCHFAEAMAMGARCATRRRRGLCCDNSVAGARGWSPTSQGLTRRPLGTPTPVCECCDVRILNSDELGEGKIYGNGNGDEGRRWQECQRRVRRRRWRTSTTARVKIGRRSNPRPCRGIGVGGGGGGGGGGGEGEGTAALGDRYIDTIRARMHRVHAGKSVGVFENRSMAGYHRRWRAAGASLERRRWRDWVGNIWRWEISPGVRNAPGQQAQTQIRCLPRPSDSSGFEEAVPVRGEGGGGEGGGGGGAGGEEGDAGNAVQGWGDAAADKDQASFNLSSSTSSSASSSSFSHSSFSPPSFSPSSFSPSSFSPSSSSSSHSSDSYRNGKEEEDLEGWDCNDVKKAKSMEVSSASSASSSGSDDGYEREQEVEDEEEKRLGKHLDDAEKRRQSSEMGSALPPPSPFSAFADVWREQAEADGGAAEEETDREKRGDSDNEGLLSGWDGLFPPPDLLRVGGGGGGGRSAVKAAADAVAGEEENQFVIPILPLGKVKFPTEPIPLQLFEPRYRFMFKMINLSKSKRFGVVWADRSSATMESVGVLCHLTQFYRVPQNGRILVNALAVCRFRVKAVIFDKPFITAEVVPTYDTDGDGLAEMAETAVVERRVWQCMQDVRRLAGKLYGHLGSLAREEVFSQEVLTWRPATEEDEDDGESLGKEGEREREIEGGGWRRRSKRVMDHEGRWVNERRRSEWFSFAVARSLIDIPLDQQQSLLDMTSTRDRLRACEEVLSDGCKYLAARSSLMDIFSR